MPRPSRLRICAFDAKTDAKTDVNLDVKINFDIRNMNRIANAGDLRKYSEDAGSLTVLRRAAFGFGQCSTPPHQVMDELASLGLAHP